jgi:hypothetical protein
MSWEGTTGAQQVAAQVLQDAVAGQPRCSWMQSAVVDARLVIDVVLAVCVWGRLGRLLLGGSMLRCHYGQVQGFLTRWLHRGRSMLLLSRQRWSGAHSQGFDAAHLAVMVDAAMWPAQVYTNHHRRVCSIKTTSLH